MFKSRRPDHFLLVLAGILFIQGCVAVPLESSRIPRPSSRSRTVLASTYQEMTGVIHIHTTYSDGTGTVEEVARIADRQKLDFIIVTDHDTLQGRREDKNGWFNKTLVLIDEEISTSHGHYLALRLPKEVRSREHGQWTAEAVSAQGGLGFIAHPLWSRKRWELPETREITGIEIYSAVQDAQEENYLWLGFWTFFTGSDFSLTKWLNRPDSSLTYWDKLLRRDRKVVAIGSPDAHGLRKFGLRLAPYEAMFKLVRNHLLVTEASEKGIYEALEQGHLFVAFDVVAEAKGFQFAAVRDEQTIGIMGDQLSLGKGLRLYAYLPSPGVVRLLKDGKEVRRAEGQAIWFDVSRPGVYRIEATRKGKPWIYSNPIYVIS